MNDVRKVIYATIALFLGVVVLWLSVIYLSACGLTLSCLKAAPKVDRTPVPTLVPGTLPASVNIAPPATSTQGADALPTEAETQVAGAAPDIARPSNPGGPGPAIGLTGNIGSGKEIFVANCQTCHGVDGAGGNPNSGTADGTIPPLNPIDSTLVNSDKQVYATNLDLFIEHGSTPEGTVPNFYMPAWGDTGALQPQQIADVIAYIISLNK
jgi:mono/diheme cytochrome c family protein